MDDTPAYEKTTEDLMPRKRLGEIRHLDPTRPFGFIEAEDFRDDVFFHQSVWESQTDMPPQIGMIVEFEIDRPHMKETGKLRATAVRPTNRPYTRRLSHKSDDRLTVKHHPKAQRRKPTWR